MDKILCHSVIGGEEITIDKNSYDPFGDSSGMALWKLDGNGTDVSGNYSMTAGAPSWATGLDGQCASLTASNTQILYRGQETTLQLNTHTISVWVKVNSMGAGPFIVSNQVCWGGDNSSYNEGSGIFIDTDGKISGHYVFLNTETTTDSNGNTLTFYGAIAKSSFIVTIGQWYHVCWVVSGNNGKLFIDGILNSEVTSVQSIRWSTDTSSYGILAIGGYVKYYVSNLVYHGPLDGLVEQCRIFNRVLTQTEITALYNEIEG